MGYSVRLLSLFLFFAAILFLSCGANAQSQDLPPGEYRAHGGAGALTISPIVGGAQKFTMWTITQNGHSCDLGGSIRSRVALILTADKEPDCVLKFSVNNDGIEVDSSASYQVCHQHFCGTSAGIGDIFLKPLPGCTIDEVKKTRAAYRRQFNKKNFVRARDLLKPVAEKCFQYMEEVEEGFIRNDLARSFLRLNDKAGCLNALGSYKEFVKLSLRDFYSSMDAVYPRIPLQRDIAITLKACRAK